MRLTTPQEAASFDHKLSGTQLTIRPSASGSIQTVEQGGNKQSVSASYVIGSGAHALGYVVQVGNHLFQSPISYYSGRRVWDMAPGYEQDEHPDFSRPVTAECLFCHSDKPRPIPDTLNSYESPPFEGAGIQCERCHGSSEAHLRNPVPGSIINPVKLSVRARDSVCEQCHLTGQVRIPNPGKQVTDFRPGQTLEDSYTVFVSAQDEQDTDGPRGTIKVVSHAEQLARSTCARNSGGKLWCGTCHDPHESSAQPAGYYREKCLTCHAETLSPSHAAPDQNCVSCHMPSRPAKDGGHTAFTDHRIERRPGGTPLRKPGVPAETALTAWHEPAPSLLPRNRALAFVAVGVQQGNSSEVIEGYRWLNRAQTAIGQDAAALTVLGTVLLTAKQPAEALPRFERALALRPDYAPYEVNLADALYRSGKLADAALHLERAIQLDPLLAQAVQLLQEVYAAQGRKAEGDQLLESYRAAMGIVGP